MLHLFKKQATVQPVAPVAKPQITNWATWKEFFKKEPVEVFEPQTIAVQRLNGKAKDVGADKALAMYNSHKAKLRNQWINPLQSVNAGFGNAQLSFYNYQTVNYWQCMQLAQDPLFAKVFNILSTAPYSKGGQITLPEGSQIDEGQLDEAVKKYKLWEEIKSGTRSSYVCGGCLVYLDFGLTSNELAEPLDLKKINCHKFKRFKHIDPINVAAIEVNTVDPTAADYMKPTKWYVIGLGVVHHSHFIQFEANPPELPMRPLTMYFGMPLTQLIKQDVANSNLVSQGMANLINRSRYIYLKADPADFATDNASQFRDRLEYMSYVQDNFGVMPLKNTEDVLQLTTSLTGFAENVEQAYLLVSAKTDIPYTELMGKSASGMNATGEGDRRKWYDKCRSIQEDNKPALLKMYGIVAGKIGDGHFVDFPDFVYDPLEEATEKELAENIKAYTDVATALVGLGANPDSIIEWLKQFKQFNLDSVDFDTSTPGLEGYGDDDDPDNNPGGGLPNLHEDLNVGDGVKAREDITPKVIAELKAMNDGEKVKAWRTTESGAHFPIKEGQSTKEALDAFLKEKRTPDLEKKVEEHFRKVYPGMPDDGIKQYVDEAFEDERSAANKNKAMQILADKYDEYTKDGKQDWDALAKSAMDEYVADTGDEDLDPDGDYSEAVEAFANAIIDHDLDTKEKAQQWVKEHPWVSQLSRLGFNKPGDDGASGDKADLQDVFGEAYKQYSGKPKEAIEKLLGEQKGHVPAAINKEGVGDIDFVWGEPGPQGYGLAHIIERRNKEGFDGEDFVRSLPDIIKDGKVDYKHQKLGRLYITSKDKNVVIRLDWNGIERNWLATAFEIYK